MAMFRNISDHSEDLANGRVVGPGQSFGLDADEQKREHNAALIDAGKFIPIPDASDAAGAGTTDDASTGAKSKGARS